MLLADWLTANRLTHVEFAPKIKRTPEAVRRYVAGERIPDKHTMPLIVRETNGEVTANDFFGVAAPAKEADSPRPFSSSPSQQAAVAEDSWPTSSPTLAPETNTPEARASSQPTPCPSSDGTSQLDVAICGVCDRRAEDPEVRSCTSTTCPMRVREAA